MWCSNLEAPLEPPASVDQHSHHPPYERGRGHQRETGRGAVSTCRAFFLISGVGGVLPFFISFFSPRIRKWENDCMEEKNSLETKAFHVAPFGC